MLKQQTDELDALKKLSIHLTSSLDLPDVLDAVVSEAVRLIENARDVNIFLYKNHKLSFGAALDADGTRNKPWSKPRSNGLTYTVARSGEMMIVENMQDHPLFQNVPVTLDRLDHRHPTQGGKHGRGRNEPFTLHSWRLFGLRAAIAKPALRPGGGRHLKCQPASDDQQAGLQRHIDRAAKPPRPG